MWIVFRSRFLDLRILEKYEKMSLCGRGIEGLINNHVWLIKIIDYRIPRLPFETAVCTFFPTTFFKNRGIIAFIRLGRVKCFHSFFCYVTRVQIDLQQNGTRSKRKTVQGHWKDSNLKMLWRSASITETSI